MSSSVERKHTDNAHFHLKCAVRFEAIDGLDEVNVLDCLAGTNRLWKRVGFSSYYGIEKQKGKGDLNVYGDNLKIIPSLDLSKFNVIDLDSYGIPAEQLMSVVANPTLPEKTVVVFTAISCAISSFHRKMFEAAGFEYGVYHKCPMLFNKHALAFWYALLYRKMGVKTVRVATVNDGSYAKHYGYFELKRSAII